MTDEIERAPLSTEKIHQMAVDFLNSAPNTAGVRNATEFAKLVLREADRLADLWRATKVCELKGHVYEIFTPHHLTEFRPKLGEPSEHGPLLNLRWATETVIICRRCSGKLVHEPKEML